MYSAHCLAKSFLLAALLVPTFNIYAQLATLVLGGVLNQLADRVDSSIQKAGAVGDHLELRAGSEIYAAIQNARVAYKDSLSETERTLTPAVRGTIDQLRSAVDALERQTAADAQQALQTAQQVSNTLPVSNRQPQITRWQPQVEVADVDGNYRVTLLGNFFYAAEDGMKPYAKIATLRIDPTTVTTQQLTFLVPRRTLVGVDAKPNPLTKIDVAIPYKEPRLFNLDLFAREAVANFTVAMAGLPSSPGAIKVAIFTPASINRTSRVRTNSDNQQSDRDDKVEIHCGPTETNRVVNSSVRFVVERSEGSSWTHRPERYDNPSVCEWIRTEHHGRGTSDKVWFHFEYDVAYSETTTTTEERTLNLKWGDSEVITFPAPSSTYRVYFDGPDGQHFETAAPNHSNRYIDVDTSVNGLRISVREMMNIRPQ